MKPVLKQVNRNWRGERGAMVIELALILPFLLVLFVVIVDLGLLIREYQILQNAAREGARFSSLPQNCIACRPVNCSDCLGGCNAANCQTQAQITASIKTRVVTYLSQEGITITENDVTVNQGYTISIGGVFSTASEIVVTHNRPLLIEDVFFLQGNAVNLRGSAVFRNLY
ncbi:MAG: TadE family protein [Acidobacteriota bacterium]